MPQLDFHWFASQLFWLLGTFAALYIVMARFTLPHIGRVIEKRQNKIAAELGKAESLKNEAEKLERQYKLELEKAHIGANKIISEADGSMATSAHEKHAELDKILNQKLLEAAKKIKANKEKAVSEMREYQIELTRILLKKIAKLEVGEKEISGKIADLAKEFN